MIIKEIQQKNCDMLIPTKWNIYEWAEKHPDTTIAHALKRVEKVFDFSDALQCGFSGGKDSTVSANLACLELNLRRLRVENHIDRDGNNRIDPLDAKWYNKRITMAMTDAEVCFTSTNDYTKRFLAKYGPEKSYDLGGNNIYLANEVLSFGGENKFTAEEIYKNVLNGANITIHNKKTHEEIKLTPENCSQSGGLDLIEFYWICLELAWQSGVSFDSGILISWDREKESQWVQPMPTKEQLHGFDCIHYNNRDKANPVPLDSLSEEAQKYHREHNNVIMVQESDLFGSNYDSNSNAEGTFDGAIEAVANFGRGPVLQNFKAGCHEKEEQDDFSYWIAQTSWLVS